MYIVSRATKEYSMYTNNSVVSMLCKQLINDKASLVCCVVEAQLIQKYNGHDIVVLLYGI